MEVLLGQRPVGIGESEQYIALVDMPHLHHPKVKNVFLHCFSLCFITYLTANIAFFFESLTLRGGKAQVSLREKYKRKSEG